ncbi:hypothetical protein KKC22_06235 [Myxococcota bacterium]|nr:hypothetical protein [Myxococcota bacterium]
MNSNVKYMINNIVAVFPGFIHYIFNEYGDKICEVEERDLFAEGRVQFFPHGSLLVKDNGVLVPVLGAYHSHKDVLLLDELYEIAGSEQVLRYALTYLAHRRENVYPSKSAESVSLRDCILFNGQLDLCDHDDHSGHPRKLGDILDAAAHEAWQRDIKKMLAGSLAGAKEQNEEDHFCLHCLNAGHRASEWGELPKILPHEVCPKCGRVTVDTRAAAFTGAAAFTSAVAAAVEEMKIAVLQDAAASLLRGAKKSGKKTH